MRPRAMEKHAVTTRTYAGRAAIIAVCSRIAIMEAEQLNALSNTLTDLRDREAQLRRYL